MEVLARIQAGEPGSERTLPQVLEAAGVVHGIDETKLTLLGRRLGDADFEAQEELLARGTSPERGKPGELSPRFPVGTVAGEKRSDGSVDFRERSLLTPVEPGHIIATYTPPALGTPNEKKTPRRRHYRTLGIGWVFSACTKVYVQSTPREVLQTTHECCEPARASHAPHGAAAPHTGDTPFTRWVARPVVRSNTRCGRSSVAKCWTVPSVWSTAFP